MILPMIFLFVLGGIQGGIGWFMVKSGLVPEKYFVGHVELATHFIAALGLLSYTLWFALKFLIAPVQKVANTSLQKLLVGIMAVLIVQLIYGAFMAGMRAAVIAPTWPDINGKMLPIGLSEHRGIAYLLFVMVLFWWFKAKAIRGNKLFTNLRFSMILLISLQVVLGILTVLNATYNDRLVVLGVAHQFTAMLVVLTLVSLLFVVRKSRVY